MKHTLIAENGKSYNVELKIENNKLYAIWDTEKSEVDLTQSLIIIKD